ncbi:ORF122 [Xestia c-nigrum granulovirus]|uniref:AcNPV ORF78 homolog n=1 Tax=Xestia c-nigrum granulosis virus TaxID=51677 RepID=P89281_GVXN|nr:ORF122 [Xestia c-nigrum granulovirus]AAC12814.1 AcNPV ORF78 homolog [Xestia c-nigrum granulovirus]AAF05236.1 ORF122 [Xestia c-nigrum granulovirus]
MQQHLDIPFDRLTIPDAVDAIPLKLAYSKESDDNNKPPVVPSAQAVYGSREEKSAQSDMSNVWFIALACITVLVVIMLISYYIVSVLRTNNAPLRDYEDDEFE